MSMSNFVAKNRCSGRDWLKNKGLPILPLRQVVVMGLTVAVPTNEELNEADKWCGCSCSRFAAAFVEFLAEFC